MVFGDGDGELFHRFTIAVDVIGHELTHGVTEATAGLLYQGQSGALNESVSDVFGSLVKQRVLGQDADRRRLADRRGPVHRGGAGRGAAVDERARHGVRRRRARSRPAARRTCATTSRRPDDNGGVHINSGIPNHAFYLAATALGGSAWEVAGRIWYDTLVSGGLKPDADFAAFAAATVQAAAGQVRDRRGAGRPVGLGCCRGHGLETGDRWPGSRWSAAVVSRAGGCGHRSTPTPTPTATGTPVSWPRWTCRRWPPRRRPRPAPDRYQYVLSVQADDGSSHRLELGEAGLPDALRPLVTQLESRARAH